MDEVNAANNRIDQQFSRMKDSLNTRQRRELSNRKYTILDGNQLDQLFTGCNITAELPFNISSYKKLDAVGRKRALIHSIRRLANMERKRPKKRQTPGEVGFEVPPGSVNGLAFGIPTDEIIEVDFSLFYLNYIF